MAEYNQVLSAIDTHNVASGADSWFDTRIKNIEDALIETGLGITVGAPIAVVAGVNSILNTGVAFANFLGSELEPFSTYEQMKALDDNLGRYYEERREGVELAGFIATSFIPGMAGVKMMQAAKAGVVGMNVAKSSGLMKSLTADYATAAKVEFASASGTPFSVLNGNTIKGLAQGFGSSALEMAAFETAVAATMYKSPVLDGQSFGDLVHHILTGTLIGGGIGGVLHGVGLAHGIKRAGKQADIELFPFRNIEEIGPNAPSDLKLINYFNQRFNIPEPALAEGIVSNLTTEARFKLIESARNETLTKLDLLIRKELNTKFSGNDAAIGEQLFNILKNAKGIEDVTAAILHAKDVSRITRSERLAYGEVLFPVQKLDAMKFSEIKTNGAWDELLAPAGQPAARGFLIRGNLSDLKVTGAGFTEGTLRFDSAQEAFNNGYDIFRNSNGTMSVNPESKILTFSPDRRLVNNLIMDLEQNGAIVEKASPGIGDLATSQNPIRVIGTNVVAGGMEPIAVKAGVAFDPLAANYLEVQARYIWAAEQKNIKWDGYIVAASDLPMLEKAYYAGDFAKGFRIKMEDGKIVSGETGERLARFIESQKVQFVQKLDGRPLDEIALRLNVTDKWLLGERDEIAKFKTLEEWNRPRYARMNFSDNLDALETYRTNYLDGAIDYQYRVAMLEERARQNFSNFSKDLYGSFLESPKWNDPGRTPTREGAGASLLGFANANYGTAGAWAQATGTVTSQLKVARKTEMAEILTPVAAAVAKEGGVAKAELSLVTNKLRSSEDAYVLHPFNPMVLIPRGDLQGLIKGTIKDSKASIEIKSAAVMNFLKSHASRLTERQSHWGNLKGAAGVADDFDSMVFYPPPLDTVNYKHFVFVAPKELHLGDKKRIIAAKDDATLRKLIEQVDPTQFKVITKQETEEWHKAMGDYEFSKGINESVVDSTLNRKGILSDFLPTTSSERILDDYMAWHTRQEDVLTTSMVYHRYNQAFTELEHLGKQYTDVATSQFRGLTERLEQSVKDPYKDIVRTSLDISRASEYQWWRSFNDIVQNTIEGPVNKLRDVFGKTEQIDDKFVAQVNKLSEELGLGTPFRDAYAAMVANGNVADKPFLARGIAKAQSILSATLLQLDFFNAVNNIVSSPIIFSAEIKSLTQAIEKADKNVAGKLAELMKVKVPGSPEIELPAASRLLREGLEAYRADHAGTGELLKRFQSIGAVTDILQQERMMLDQLTINFAKATPAEIESRVKKAVEFGKKWTGNKMAEEMTRFLSAYAMKRITDLGREAGVIASEKEANEYIQLFVNRTQGNYLHSQRPIVFQGVIGQAVSLFQTYQFNLMQQLFRHIGEGDKKSLGMLLGLQGSIYGMQGLPGFHFINTHIVGNASGNTEHRDLYTASKTVFGQELGNWILYGAGANALGVIDPSMKVNLYTRGDINPRQVTVIPVIPQDIPIVNASIRIVKNLFNTAKRIGAGGAVWPVIAQAIEHNGLSRPLAGLAASVQGYTTTSQGSLLSGGQDLWNIATLTRVAGGKPFDEAVAIDALYRINAYRAKDISRIQALGSAVKSTVVGNGIPTEQQIVNFAAAYAKSGGKIDNFNRFFTNTMMSANQSQVNKIAERLNSPYARQLQIIMGGQPMPDFINQPVERVE